MQIAGVDIDVNRPALHLGATGLVSLSLALMWPCEFGRRQG